jgi:hypothetical protein
LTYELVAQGTVEERMLEQQQRNRALDVGRIERLFQPLG